MGQKMVPANLYDPHATVEKEGKNGPGPGHYTIVGSFPEQGTKL